MGAAAKEPTMKKESTNSGADASAALRDSAEHLTESSKRAAKAATASALGASRKVVAAAPAVVIKAVTILEEELASGLGVVRRIEQRFLDVDTIRQQGPDAVMSKFRRDGHEAVDIILDVLTAAAQTVEAQAGRFINVTAGATKSETDDDDALGMRVPALRVPGRVLAGRAGEVAMSLENASDMGTSGFTLHSSDLVGASGARIPSSSIAFSPDTLSVGPKQAGRVTVKVHVPDGTPAGTYEGLVRATQLESLRAMLIVVVA